MVSVKSAVTVSIAPNEGVLSTTATALELALISVLKRLVCPFSATASTPALAVPPLLQKVTLSLCRAPIKGEKCASDGTPPEVTLVVHLPSNVTL